MSCGRRVGAGSYPSRLETSAPCGMGLVYNHARTRRLGEHGFTKPSGAAVSDRLELHNYVMEEHRARSIAVPHFFLVARRVAIVAQLQLLTDVQQTLRMFVVQQLARDKYSHTVRKTGCLEEDHWAK